MLVNDSSTVTHRPMLVLLVMTLGIILDTPLASLFSCCVWMRYTVPYEETQDAVRMHRAVAEQLT